MKKNARFEHIGSVMEKLMGELRSASGDFLDVCLAWTEAVGSLTAKNAMPVELKGKMLVVNVAGSVWLQELQFSSMDIIENINGVIGKPVLEDIQYRIGPVKNG